jgi:CheY-like chemotaxis protein
MMQKKNHNAVHCCYFPTSFCLIDDDERYLNMIALNLQERWNCVLHYDPKEAIQFLLQESQTPNFFDNSVSYLEEETFNQKLSSLNLQAIHQAIYQRERFEQISVVIVDYAMRGMNGLELCEQIKNKTRAKIILLTGEADEKIAVDAFNQGLIHQYVRKDSRGLEALMQAVLYCENLYFESYSRQILSQLDPESSPVKNYLNHQNFQSLFFSFFNQKQFLEYYLLDGFGSFLFLDGQGKIGWLIVRTDGEIGAWYETASYADSDVPEAILNALKNREKLLFLYSEKEYELHPSEWLPYLHTAHLIQLGNTKIYYAFFEGTHHNDIQKEAIQFYGD